MNEFRLETFKNTKEVESFLNNLKENEQFEVICECGFGGMMTDTITKVDDDTFTSFATFKGGMDAGKSYHDKETIRKQVWKNRSRIYDTQY